MKKKCIPFFLTFLLTFMVFYGCSSKFPDTSVLTDDLEKGLNWRPLKDSLMVNKVFSLIDVDITKSSVSCDEQCECILEFRAKLRSKETFFYSYQYKGLYHKIPEWAKANKKVWQRINPGKFYEVRGKGYYDLYETGWKIRQFDAPILNEKKEKITKFYIPKIVLKDNMLLFDK
ncbi:membrane or secreted protein [Candidatus Magnetomorum sp. HK-1]|nr:membrane or secreted protein [Candidatus Magnetomorum sp. HK-1]